MQSPDTFLTSQMQSGSATTPQHRHNSLPDSRYMYSGFSVSHEAPPTLAFGSSSPVFESPQTVRHPGRLLPKMHILKDNKTKPDQRRRFSEVLPSSPIDTVSFSTSRKRQCTTRRSSKARKLAKSHLFKDACEAQTNVGADVQGKQVPFHIDSLTGRAEMVKPSTPMVSQRPVLEFMSSDSDTSEVCFSGHSSPTCKGSQGFDALSAFIQSVAKSRVHHAKHGSNESFCLPSNMSFLSSSPNIGYGSHLSTPLMSLTSNGNLPSTPSILVTPPGATMGLDMYNTGMTPYLPRS